MVRYFILLFLALFVVPVCATEISFNTEDAIVSSPNLSYYYNINLSEFNDNAYIIYGYQSYENNVTNGSIYIMNHYNWIANEDNVSLSYYISELQNNFDGRRVKLFLWIIDDYNSYWNNYDYSVANDEIIFDMNFTYIYEPDVPEPTPSPTATPNPTYLPNQSIDDNISSEYRDNQSLRYTNSTGRMKSRFNQSVNILSDSYENVGTTVNDANATIRGAGGINATMKARSMLILLSVVPTIISGIHWKIKAIYTMILVMIVLLIVLGRR